MWSDSSQGMATWDIVREFLHLATKRTGRVLEELYLRINVTVAVRVPLPSSLATLAVIQELLLSVKTSSLILMPCRQWPRGPFTTEERTWLEKTFDLLHRDNKLVMPSSEEWWNQ